MDRNKFYTVEKEFNGKKYVAQFSGVSMALRSADESHIDGTDSISAEKFGQYVLDHAIVEPKGLTPDDFDSLEEYNEVFGWARDVMQGKFRNKSDKNTDKAKG